MHEVVLQRVGTMQQEQQQQMVTMQQEQQQQMVTMQQEQQQKLAAFSEQIVGIKRMRMSVTTYGDVGKVCLDHSTVVSLAEILSIQAEYDISQSPTLASKLRDANSQWTGTRSEEQLQVCVCLQFSLSCGTANLERIFAVVAQDILYNMFQHLQECLPRCDGYVALDTHKQGFYKCPIGKIDIAMSLSKQVSCDRYLFAAFGLAQHSSLCYMICLQAYWATLVSAVELKIDLTKASQYTEALGQVSRTAAYVIYRLSFVAALYRR